MAYCWAVIAWVFMRTPSDQWPCWDGQVVVAHEIDRQTGHRAKLGLLDGELLEAQHGHGLEQDLLRPNRLDRRPHHRGAGRHATCVADPRVVEVAVAVVADRWLRTASRGHLWRGRVVPVTPDTMGSSPPRLAPCWCNSLWAGNPLGLPVPVVVVGVARRSCSRYFLYVSMSIARMSSGVNDSCSVVVPLVLLGGQTASPPPGTAAVGPQPCC